MNILLFKFSDHSRAIDIQSITMSPKGKDNDDKINKKEKEITRNECLEKELCPKSN